MPSSQNGYSANVRSVVSSRLVPGTTRKLTVRNGAPGDLLLYVAGRFDKEVEDIDAARSTLDDWGYAERPIRGGTTLSNHASGTAIDLNATQHPLGTAPTKNFTAAQIAAIRKIVADCGGCIRWGGDYTGRKDGMHFEVIKNESACAAQLAKLQNRSTAPATPVSGNASGILKKGDKGPEVARLQTFLNKMFPSYSKLTVDGDFGPGTEAVVKEFQRRSKITADGEVGPQTRAKLGGF